MSLLPVNGAYDRSMFMPPNSGANASYLGTLRELLVHERRGRSGRRSGSTSRSRRRARGSPTARRSTCATRRRASATSRTRSRVTARAIVGHLVLPHTAHVRLRLRLPAGERLVRVLVGSSVVVPGGGGTIDLGNRHGSWLLRATVR